MNAKKPMFEWHKQHKRAMEKQLFITILSYMQLCMKDCPKQEWLRLGNKLNAKLASTPTNPFFLLEPKRSYKGIITQENTNLRIVKPIRLFKLSWFITAWNGIIYLNKFDFVGKGFGYE